MDGRWIARSGVIAFALAAVAHAPVAAQGCAPNMGRAAMNALTPAEQAGGWRLLFDGKTTDGWRGFRKSAMPDGWKVIEGTLTRVTESGDIITNDEFGNFELALEWKISSGGNSGIMYRVTEAAEATYETGPEMQVLDDERHADGKSRLTSAGAAYGLYPSPPGVVKPAGQWNAARIVVNGNHVEHWLNGRKVAEYELGSAEWEAKVKASKFQQWPGYGRATRGHIALQDHGDLVSYRNIKIRELP
jgi:3-keto-disaccharide hydrolase